MAAVARLLAALWVAGLAAAAGNLVVNTANGPVAGFAVPEGRIWRGIPYAEPPVGARRWQRSVPLAQHWSIARQALAFSAACPQVRRGWCRHGVRRVCRLGGAARRAHVAPRAGGGKEEEKEEKMCVCVCVCVRA